MQVKENERRFPGLRVSYLHSSIFLAPKCHCDPNAYFFNDDLAQKTVDAHLYINGVDEDLGCDLGGAYIKGLRWVGLISRGSGLQGLYQRGWGLHQGAEFGRAFTKELM